MKKKYKYLCCAAIALVPSMPALAQEEGQKTIAEGIQDIVVTAQRRQESVQKASVPISVLSSDLLTSSGTTQVKDIAAFVPGVQIGQAGSATQIYIRGVGDTGTTPITNPAVAFSVDGVSIGRSTAVDGSFYDIQRVEVLKGPQGTLYGRNASGGAINVITKQPVLGERSGYVNFEFGNYERVAVDGAINLPVSETMAVRGAFQILTRDGYLNDGSDDQRQQSGRLQMLWKPSDRLTVTLGGDYTHVGGIGGGQVAKIDGESPWTSSNSEAGVNDFNAAAVANGQQCVPTSNFPTFALYPNQGGCADGFTQLTKGDGNGDRGTNNRLWGVRAQIDYDLDFATLTVIPAYRAGTYSYTLYPTFQYHVDRETSKQTSFEARLGHDTADLKWVVGGFFYDEKQDSEFLVLSGSVQNNTQTMNIKTRSYAAFGQATYSIAEPFRVIAGLRYTSDRREIDAVGYSNNPSLDFATRVQNGECLPTDERCVMETSHGQKTFRKVNWRGGVEYDLSPSNMLYATAATGFKAGGFSANLSADADVSGPTDAGQADSYKPETLTAYTLGSRNRFFGNKLQVNLEAFLWKYKDHQENRVTIDALGNVAQTYVNAGKATQYGLSMDMIAKVTRNDTLTAGVEYLHSKYDTFKFDQPTTNPTTGQRLAIEGVTTGCSVTDGANNTSVIDCSGKQLNRAPKWTANASYAHRFDLSNGGDIELRGTVSYIGARWLSVDFLDELRDKARTTFDANLAYHSPNANLSVRAFIRNITNEPVYSSGQSSPFLPGYTVLTVGAPRTYGVGLTANF